MSLRILTLFYLLLLVYLAIGQEREINIGDNTISSRTYNISYSNERRIIVKNKFSKTESYIEKKQLTTEFSNDLQLINKDAISKIVENTLSKGPRNGRILIVLYVNSSGQVEEVEFVISNSTLLTLNEIDKLSENIKKGVKFNVGEKFKKSNKIVSIVQALRV